MNLLIVIPFHTGNAAQAERVIDHIYHLNGKKALRHHVLLAWHTETHKELRDKISVSAELAFSGTHWLEIRKMVDERVPKFAHISNVFHQTAAHIQNNFVWPWLWLEPDCSPLSGTWADTIADAYEQQPKRYFGLHLNSLKPDKTVDYPLMARTAIYPANANKDMSAPKQDANLVEHRFAHEFHPRSTGTKLFQQATVLTQEDMGKIRKDAVLLHGDKNGIVLTSIYEKSLQPKVETNGHADGTCAPAERPRRGRKPRQVLTEPVAPIV